MPASVDKVESLQPLDTHHVAQLPPAWTETLTREQPAVNTSTATVTIEAATATPDSMVTPATPDPDAAQLLFVKMGAYTVMSVSSSGGGAVLLTLPPPADCAAAKISPDGEQIAYFDEMEKSTIFLAAIDGSEATALTQIQHYEVEGLVMPVWDVIWSPKGMWLAVVTESPYLTGYAELYIVDPSGNREQQYISLGPVDPYSSYWVSWSPDEKWVSYTCLMPESLPIVQRISDSHYNVIDHFDGFFPGTHFAWSPDSKLLAVVFFYDSVQFIRG